MDFYNKSVYSLGKMIEATDDIVRDRVGENKLCSNIDKTKKNAIIGYKTR